MEFKNFYYSFKEGIDGYKINIKPKKPKRVPKTLVKYYPLNDYSIDALRNNYFYAAHPYELNDPYDCLRDLLNISKQNQDTIYQFLFSKFGILSFSTNELNILMWAYYALHDGFCIKYSYKNLPINFHGPFPINYCDKLESTKEIEPGLSFLILSNIKLKHWIHEEEWRILAESDTPMKLPDFIEKKMDRANIKPRKFRYENYFKIKEILLGYKIVGKNNMNYFGEYIEFETDHCNKELLIDFVAEMDCKKFLMDVDLNGNYSLRKRPITIEKIRPTLYRFYFDNKG
jgi:hypothetical protein